MQVGTTCTTALARAPTTPLVRPVAAVAAVAAAAKQPRQPRGSIAATTLEGELLQRQQRARQTASGTAPPPIPGATLHAARAISAYLSIAGNGAGAAAHGRQLDLRV